MGHEAVKLRARKSKYKKWSFKNFYIDVRIFDQSIFEQLEASPAIFNLKAKLFSLLFGFTCFGVKKFAVVETTNLSVENKDLEKIFCSFYSAIIMQFLLIKVPQKSGQIVEHFGRNGSSGSRLLPGSKEVAEFSIRLEFSVTEYFSPAEAQCL